MKKLLMLILISGFTLSGCQEKEQVKSKEYYLSHQDELVQTLKDCYNTGSRNCSNARDAQETIKEQELEEKRKQETFAWAKADKEIEERRRKMIEEMNKK